MRVTINGSSRELPDSATVLRMLQLYELEGERVAVECNGSIVPHDQFGRYELHDGDVIELVRFVGGG